MFVFMWTPFVWRVALLAAVSIPIPVTAGSAADSVTLREARTVLARLAERQRAAKSVELRFESLATGPDGDPLPKAQGTLWLADSGRFRLEHAQGLMVSDGKTLRQYFPANQQVILKNSGDVAPGSVGGVLLHFLNASPVAAEKTAGGLLRVTLDPAGTGDNLDSLLVEVRSDPPELRRVITVDATGARTVYTIRSCKFGASVDPRDFSFTPPKGVETVDMR